MTQQTNAAATTATTSAEPVGATAGGAAPAAPTAGKRVFVFNGTEYPDPDPQLTPDQIRRDLARFVPELTNADVREEQRQDGSTQYVFTRRLGTKGAAAIRTPTAAGTAEEARRIAAEMAAGRAESPASAPSGGPHLIELLRQVPAKHLAIFALAHELVLPDGEFDLDTAARRGVEVERACDEAQEYARLTQRAREALSALPARR